MKDFTTFLDNNRKSTIYLGRNINRIYHYLEMIVYPNKFTTSGQRSNNFGPSSSTNNDTATTQPIIAALRVRYNNIWEYYGIIGHKSDAWIIRGPKSLPPSLIGNMNQLNSLDGDGTTEPQREWNIQHPAVNFKYRTSPPKTSPVVLAIMGIFNHHSIDNGDVEV